jgi:ribonuclease T
VTMKLEHFISVDIEAAGPIPGEYSMLSLGACLVDDVSRSFHIEFQPINLNAEPNALKVTGISLEELQVRGIAPAVAMQRFQDWITETVESEDVPVFVGFNAPFDWSFVNYYFHRFLGHNPFGFAALDIKAFYMGRYGTHWLDTKSSKIAAALEVAEEGDHNALHDAIYQARLFSVMRSRI